MDHSSIKQAIFNLHPLTDKEWEAFASHLTVKNFSKGEYLIREGQIETRVHFLDQGSTRHYFIRDGKDYTVDFQFKGEFITAYYSLITGEPSEIFIEALEDTKTISIQSNRLKEFYDQSHNGERIGRIVAENQYINRLRREMTLLSQTAEQRYAALLQKNPGLVCQLSVKHLSSYLGVQPESLSRIRKIAGRN
jgi:CRP-like cAMP-binding protein